MIKINLEHVKLFFFKLSSGPQFQSWSAMIVDDLLNLNIKLILNLI